MKLQKDFAHYWMVNHVCSYGVEILYIFWRLSKTWILNYRIFLVIEHLTFISTPEVQGAVQSKQTRNSPRKFPNLAREGNVGEEKRGRSC